MTLVVKDLAAPPKVFGSEKYLKNKSLIENTLAYGSQIYGSRRSRSAERIKSHKENAKAYERLALFIGDLIIRGQDESDIRKEWCSGCFTRAKHVRVADRATLPLPYLCQSCGGPTSICAVPRCGNMATRLSGEVRVPRFCAEHRHEIPSFEKIESSLDSLNDVEAWLKFEKEDMAKAARVTAAISAGTVVFAPLAFVSAPLIGGAIGASILGGSLSGAAATSHGLAMLGLGSLASGGFGMAGGIVTVTAVGSLLGGGISGVVAAAYAGDDPSFKVEMLQTGSLPPVVIASGFLTESIEDWDSWKRMICKRYEGHAIYRVHWGSKELKNLQNLGLAAGASVKGAKVFGKLAMRASVSASKLSPLLTFGTGATAIAKNPWSLAISRADKTAVILADILSRTDTMDFILVGHSLGARIMASTAMLMGEKSQKPRLREVHLLAAALGSNRNWTPLNDSVSNTVWNYFSSSDKVLSVLYKVAELGDTAIGSRGIPTKLKKIRNIDMSNKVKNHSDYFEILDLR